jgi:hypothetical protein
MEAECHASDMGNKPAKVIAVQSQGRPISATPGSTVNAAYAEREVKVFGILEGEVEIISILNTQAIAFFSAGSSLASIAVGIWVTNAFVEKPIPTGEVLSHFFAPLVLTMALVSFWLGIWARRRRGSIWDKIRTESIQKGSVV